MKAESSDNFRKFTNLMYSVQDFRGQIVWFLTQRIMRTYSYLISKSGLHCLKNQPFKLQMDSSFDIHKMVSFLREFLPVLTFSLFACRRVLMRQVFDTWLLNTCKQQEYRMAEKRVNPLFYLALLRK